MSKDLTQRLIVALIGIPILLFVFYVGKLYLLVFLGIVVILGMWEFSKILNKTTLLRALPDIIICFFVYLCTALPNIISSFQDLVILLLLFQLLRVVHGLYYKTSKRVISDYLLTILGWVYIGVLAGLIYKLGIEFHDQRILLLLLISIWITDSAAYFIGIRFGKHRGIFPVSPNKSLEGFIAGVIAPIIVCLTLYFSTTIWSFKQLLFVALSAGLFGQLGDLFESKIKRTGGVKDSSSIFPGHGGILDRIDSLLLAGPVLYMLLKFVP